MTPLQAAEAAGEISTLILIAYRHPVPYGKCGFSIAPGSPSKGGSMEPMEPPLDLLVMNSNRI